MKGIPLVKTGGIFFVMSNDTIKTNKIWLRKINTLVV